MHAQISIDWLTFSVKDSSPDKVIKDYLGMNPALFRAEAYGLMGYQRMRHFNHIVVCYDAMKNDFFKNQGVCVSMSGAGCRAFETVSSFAKAEDSHGLKSSAFPVLFSLLGAGLVDKKVNVSRLDLACDDRQGYLNMETLVEKVRLNEINSRISKRTVMQQFDGLERSGSTVYLGSPSSEFRVRIYDKALEQETPNTHWIRVEMVLRSKHACSFIQAFNESDHVGILAAQIANGKFSFIEKDDSNISRCTVCSWWLDFLNELEALKLVSREITKHSVDRVCDWVELQVSPSLAIILETFGFGKIFELALAGKDRLSRAQRAVIDDYNGLRASMA